MTVGNTSSLKFSLDIAALSNCFVAAGSIERVANSIERQVPLPARGLLVKSNVE